MIHFSNCCNFSVKGPARTTSRAGSRRRRLLFNAKIVNVRKLYDGYF